MGVMLNAAPMDAVNPCLVLTVSRDDIVKDTINQLHRNTSADLKKPLKVGPRSSAASIGDSYIAIMSVLNIFM